MIYNITKKIIYIQIIITMTLKCNTSTSSEAMIESSDFTGSIEDARQIASSYRLASDINLSSIDITINDNSENTDYDNSITYVHIKDKSQDFLKTIRELLCLYITTDLPALVSLENDVKNKASININNCY